MIVSPKTRINNDSTADSINKVANLYQRKRESNVSTGSKVLKLPTGKIKNGQEVILQSNEYTLSNKVHAGNDYNLDDSRQMIDMPGMTGTNEDNLPPHKITLKERSTTNWREKKILDDNGFVSLEQKRLSTPLSRNYDDYSVNADQKSKQGDHLLIVPDYLKNSPYGQGK